MIAVIDYRAGNVTSVVKALHALGATDVQITADPEQVLEAERVVLPGVGHFASTQVLEDSGIKSAVSRSIARGIPFLGICVGLQWLFAGSTEAEHVAGLGAFPGRCERFPTGTKVPHVGWNSLRPEPASRLMQHLGPGAFVYYTHAYRAPIVKETAAVTEYSGPFTGAVERNNVMGVQFHPEKSGEAGLQVLRNFLNWAPAC